MVSVVHPAWAGPQERANALFVESVKLIQAAINEPDVEVRLKQLTEAQENLQHIIEDYPSSNLAVKLISGQSIGKYSIDSVRDGVEWAYSEALEERSRIAAMKAEDLLSQLAEIQTLEEGKTLAEEFTALIAQLQSDYGATIFLGDLRLRFDDQYKTKFNTWARTVGEPIELLLTKLEATQSAEEAEPLVKIINKNLSEFSQIYSSSSYHQSLSRRFTSVQTALPKKWAAPLAEEIVDLLTELKATRTAEEGAPFISTIRNKIDQLSAKFGSTSTLSRVQSNFQDALQSQPNAWLDLEIELVDNLIATFSKSKSIEGTTEIVDAINQLVVKHGWSAPLYALRSRFKGALSNTGYRQAVIKKIK